MFLDEAKIRKYGKYIKRKGGKGEGVSTKKPVLDAPAKAFP
jgi:hypothetical protein